MELVRLSWSIDWESGGVRRMIFVVEDLKLWILLIRVLFGNELIIGVEYLYVPLFIRK